MVKLFVAFSRAPVTPGIPVIISVHVDRNISCLSKRIRTAEMGNRILRKIYTSAYVKIFRTEYFIIMQTKIDAMVKAHLKIRIANINTQWIIVIAKGLKLGDRRLNGIAAIR